MWKNFNEFVSNLLLLTRVANAAFVLLFQTETFCSRNSTTDARTAQQKSISWLNNRTAKWSTDCKTVSVSIDSPLCGYYPAISEKVVSSLLCVRHASMLYLRADELFSDTSQSSFHKLVTVNFRVEVERPLMPSVYLSSVWGIRSCDNQDWNVDGNHSEDSHTDNIIADGWQFTPEKSDPRPKSRVRIHKAEGTGHHHCSHHRRISRCRVVIQYRSSRKWQ